MAITLKRQLNEEEKKTILTRFGRKCFANNHDIPESDKLHFDHIRAHALGGQSELDNIAPMCEFHNKAKGMLPLEDFRIKLQIEEFFENGEKQTLKHLLEFFKTKKLITDFGQSVSLKESGKIISAENHSFNNAFDLHVCPLTKWKYFYGNLPIDILNSDDEDDQSIGLQPRYLIFDKVFELYRHFQIYPVLQPSIGRVKGDKILLFDGQHKAAALLWNGRKILECKIYVNPEIRILNQTNIAAHDRFAQTRFFSPVLIQKLGQQFGKDFEAYKNIEDGQVKSEIGFLEYLERIQDTTMTRAERNKRFRSYLYDSVLNDPTNKMKSLISSSNRGSMEEPITVDMLSKSIFSCFLNTEPVADNMASDSYKRELEFSNNIQLLNILFDLALFNWNKDSSPTKTEQIKLERIFASKSIMAWSELFRDAVCAKLEITDSDERARPFYRELTDTDFDKIRNIFSRLIGIQFWSLPKDSEIDSVIAGNKTAVKDWLKSKGLTSGYLLGAQE